jgi:myo-inositol 2-dehydrogenase/D-chiro-inositol 1-dehydrogenase
MTKHRVGLIGCGRMGRIYAEAYTRYADCELVAIAESHPDRRAEAGAEFGVPALFPDARSMLAEVVPDAVSVVLPTRYMPDAVIACARAGVRAISAEKPILARLADGDAMLAACRERGVVFSGGNLQRALPEVQEAAGWIRAGRIGTPEGMCLHLGRETSGGGVQPLCIARLWAGSEVESVIGWIDPPEDAASDSDLARVRGLLRFANGLVCPVFPETETERGVEVWGEHGRLRWNWGPPTLDRREGAGGEYRAESVSYQPYEYSEFGYLTGALRCMLAALAHGHERELAVSGEDLCRAVEIALALKVSARRGSAPVRLPLEDRSLALYPVPYRWLGGDATEGRYPDASGRKLDG